MRPEVKHLVGRGRLPSSNSNVSTIQAWQEGLEKITPPVSDSEAAALIELFPLYDDECYGLAWTLLHLIESAPDWPLEDYLHDRTNPWVARLRQAAKLD
jgi:hypothetical protein